MRAILLAAGEGSRLRPFTAAQPKPMVRAANKPIMRHAIEGLVQNGVQDITVVVGYQRERVQAYFGDGQKFGARLTYAFQHPLTGTAPALATAPTPTEPFLVLGGDNLVDGSLIKAALGAPAPAIVVHRSNHPERYGVATLDGDRLVQLVEKPRDPRSTWVNTGVYSLTPEFHRLASTIARGGGFGGIPDVIQRALADGVAIQAVKSDALWSDAVYPWDLLRVNSDGLRTHAQPFHAPGVGTEPPILVAPESSIGMGTMLGAGTCIGSNVVIGAQSVVENCVIYDDVQIGPGSILRNTVVGAGTRIGPRFTALSGPCDIQSVDGWHHLDDFGGVIGEDCRIGGAVTLLPGAVLGNHVHAAPTRSVSGNIQDGVHLH